MHGGTDWLQDAVRADAGEVVNMLVTKGAMVMGKDGKLQDLNESPLAGNVRVFGGESEACHSGLPANHPLCATCLILKQSMIPWDPCNSQIP